MDKEVQKQEAIKRMRILKLMPQIIKEFEKKDVVYYSERQNKFFSATLYWLTNHQEYVEAVKKFEQETNSLVYHAQLTHTNIGDMLSLLYVSKYEEEWEREKEDLRRGETIAMVINGEIEDMGYIGLKPSMGGVTRTY